MNDQHDHTDAAGTDGGRATEPTLVHRIEALDISKPGVAKRIFGPEGAPTREDGEVLAGDRSKPSGSDAPLTTAQIVEKLREKVESTDFDALTNEVSSYETLLSAWEDIEWLETECRKHDPSICGNDKARADVAEVIGGE